MCQNQQSQRANSRKHLSILSPKLNRSKSRKTQEHDEDLKQASNPNRFLHPQFQQKVTESTSKLINSHRIRHRNH
jgi:hypothetical protein